MPTSQFRDIFSAPRRSLRLAAAAGLIIAAVSCGKKGDPLPPLRPVPARVADLAATRGDAGIELRFTIPAENMDRSTPAAIDRIEIYAAPVMKDAPPLTADAVVDTKRLRARVLVKPPAGETPPAANAKPDLRPAPGNVATFVDRPEPAMLANATALQYVAVGVSPSRGRRGPVAMVTVPLAEPPAPPKDAKITYDDKTLTITWSATAGQSYRVLSATGATPVALGAPLAAPPFTQPVSFGSQLCFAIRALSVAERITIEGPASAPVCETPRDTFGPPAPTGLNVLQDGAAITLVWTGVEAADLAGYMILRRDGASETLRPLNTAPITATTFRDEQVQSGATYIYSVVAVDKLNNPSEQSNRQSVTVR